jgi:hypothetical protein
MLVRGSISVVLITVSGKRRAPSVWVTVRSDASCGLVIKSL